MASSRPKHVLAYFTWSTPALWHGVRAYAHEAGWLLVSPNHVHGPPEKLHERRFDGVMLLIAPYEVFDSRASFPGAKIVNMQDTAKLEADGRCTIDHERVGRLAAEYLHDLGYRNFMGLCLNVEIHTLRMRLDGFRQGLKDLGQHYHEFVSELWLPSPQDLLSEVKKIVEKVGLPLGVFSPDDNMADLFMQAAAELGYRIPEDIAVVGSNNERALCEMCRIPLSSIDVNFSRLGYEAARQLDQLMNGDSKAPQFIKIPPLMVEKRRSTEKVLSQDTIVRAIMEYIREHFAEKITAEHVIQDIHASRSVAYERFRKAMGRSIGKEIERVRLEHAKTLLTDTDYKIDAVARLSGYLNTSAFCRAFRTAVGKTPTDYRVVLEKAAKKQRS